MFDPFRPPFKVEVNPFGESPGEEDNIFIMDADGCRVMIIAKHPVWTALSQGRLKVAHEIVEQLNKVSCNA